MFTLFYILRYSSVYMELNEGDTNMEQEFEPVQEEAQEMPAMESFDSGFEDTGLVELDLGLDL